MRRTVEKARHVPRVEQRRPAARGCGVAGTYHGSQRPPLDTYRTQVAVACLLLVGASLLGRSFVALMNADRGYDPSNLLTARLSLPAAYSMERRIQVIESIVGRLRRVAGVRDVAYGNALPLLTAGGFRAFKMRPPSDPSTASASRCPSATRAAPVSARIRR